MGSRAQGGDQKTARISMDPKLLWLVLLIILTLVQIVMLLVKNRKTNNPGKYGERIAALEKGQEEIEKDFETFKKENREDHQKLFDKFDGMR